MKRILIALFFSLSLIFLVSCKPKNTYTPTFTLAEGFVLENDRITATVIGEGSLRIGDFILSSDAITVFKGSSSDEYVQGLDAEIPLAIGKNRMVIRFSNGTDEKEYDFVVDYISIQSFSIVVKNPEKTYHIGETFDKSTITVLAVKEDGTEFEVKQYTPEYEFTELGKNTVIIELDGYYESFTVTVTEEYLPTLDVNDHADGVFYRIDGDSATLLRAQDKEGFFAVPHAVRKDGREYPVTEIGARAFSASWITGVKIAESVRVIGSEAFSGCRALEWIELPDEMDEIGDSAFYGCEALTSAAIPEGITELKTAVFRNCKSLTAVTLPSTLKTIAARAFRECNALEQIAFPKDLLSIGDEAFHSCKDLSTVIVENLDRLGDSAFAHCDQLTYFCIGNVKNAGTGIFTESKKATVYAPASSEILQKAANDGVRTAELADGDYQIVSLPTEFPIEEGYPYHQTLILHLSDGALSALSDYAVEYPKDACGYLEATVKKGDFSHTFTIFISYTEEISLDTDTRGVLYFLDSRTGQATLLQAPEWVKESGIYQPETEGLFLVPTTLWREGKMYVVVLVEETAFAQTQNVEKVFIPILTKES